MAFRSLSRLSSALSAKASTLRSFLLDLSSLRLGGDFFSAPYSVRMQGLRSQKNALLLCLFLFLGCLDHDRF